MSKAVEAKTKILLALSKDKLDILDEMVSVWPLVDGKRMNRTRFIRLAIDELLLKTERNREGWGETEIPPVPMGKIRALVNQDYWTSETAVVEHAVNSFLDRVENSLDQDEFERRLLRSKIQAGGLERRRPGKGRTK